ncbi:hypothetical protein JAAARDRAFT_61900 [Jaapia argillacea MUCL 33604]|uniref:Uncharacterized protein n=1 Tax=Jaapia argillacea MUCL 33604 TaxID=933084 RepID=A0A067PCX3_9AGAM|nr:hypothetical protein JAAARDRAFT_61900 [Jaapia argillacea MUCL 33604]
MSQSTTTVLRAKGLSWTASSAACLNPPSAASLHPFSTPQYARYQAQPLTVSRSISGDTDTDSITRAPSPTPTELVPEEDQRPLPHEQDEWVEECKRMGIKIKDFAFEKSALPPRPPIPSIKRPANFTCPHNSFVPRLATKASTVTKAAGMDAQGFRNAESGSSAEVQLPCGDDEQSGEEMMGFGEAPLLKGDSIVLGKRVREDSFVEVPLEGSGIEDESKRDEVRGSEASPEKRRKLLRALSSSQ